MITILNTYYEAIPRRVQHGEKISDVVGAISFEEATRSCINFISEQRSRNNEIITTAFNEMSGEEIRAWEKQNEDHIHNFVTTKKPRVISPINSLETLTDSQLISYLKREINDYSILTDVLRDPATNEIQINSYKDIMIERKGFTGPLYDPQHAGRRIEFTSPQACTNFINRLLMFSNNSVTESAVHSVVTASTPEGWRVQAFGSAAVANEQGATSDLYLKSATAVIRLHSSEPIPMSQLIEYNTLSDDMGHFLGLCGKYPINTFVAGDLGSGKTTVVQAIIDKIPEDLRMVVLERASELKCRHFNEDGYMTNNVLSLSYEEYPGEHGKTPHINSIRNVQAGVLRASAQVEVLGEVLKDHEIAFALEAMDTISVIFTGHGISPKGCCYRITDACISSHPGQTRESLLNTVCSSLDIIVIATRMKDGSRKITSIAEVEGTAVENGTVVPKINTLYEYVQLGYDKKTGHVYGHHVHVGNISKTLLAKMSRLGLDIEDREFLTKPIDASKHLLYNGKPGKYETIPASTVNTPVKSVDDTETVVSQINSMNDWNEEEDL